MANQAWQIKSPGKLELVDLGSSLPQPGPKQVLVRIGGAALNYRDILVISSSPDYPVHPEPNLVPGSDGAGTVEQAGEGSVWKKGDRVVIFLSNWLRGNDSRDLDMTKIAGSANINGTLQRYLVWDDDKLVRVPEALSILEASTMITAGTTAHRALFHNNANIRPGAGITVLTQGTGGVSCYAIQLAAAAGADVIAMSSSDEKLGVAKRLGAKHCINYRSNPDWSREVLKMTGGRGVDLVVDVVGAEGIKQALGATRHGGTIVTVGLLSQDPNAAVDIMTDVLYGGKTIQGQIGAASCELAKEMSEFMDKHEIHPQIARSFRFEDAQEALEEAGNSRGAGKVVVEI